MTEAEVRKKCGLKSGELISTNLGLLDILKVEKNIVTLGMLATGSIITETTESVILKLTNNACKRKQNRG